MKDRHRGELLTQRKETGKSPRSPSVMLDAPHAIAAWLQNQPSRVERLEIVRTLGVRERALVELAQAKGVPCVLREDWKNSGVRGRVVAVCRPFPYRDLSDVDLEQHATGVVLVLDHVMDPRNVGAIIRTAAAVGVLAVVVPKDRASPVTPEVERAAAGATALVAIVRVVNIVRALQRLKEAGFWVVALDASAKSNLLTAQLSSKIAIVVGGESGVSHLVRQRCDEACRIPMSTSVESLNVSVAASVALFAWACQHKREWS